MSDDDWLMTEHSPNVAMGHAFQWASMARVQVRRVLDPEPRDARGPGP